MKTALITGASGGIGSACVARFLEAGFRIAAVSRDVTTLGPYDERVTAVEADLGTEAGRAALVKHAPERLAALVHVAGVNPREPFDEMTEATLRQAFEVNFFAPMLVTRALAPRLEAGGAVAFVSSTLAQRAAPAALAYAASKAAVEGAMRVLAIELGARGVRALAISPGLIDTAMMREGRSEEEQRALAALSPLGRVGDAAEVAEMVFAAATSAFTTGVVIPVDGGLTAGFSR